jgi:mannose-6-phosphate isomerase-like protein (cupin superfamily)
VTGTSSYRPRRVVTGHDFAGQSVVVQDAPVPIVRSLPEDGVLFAEIWQTGSSPAPISAKESFEPTDRDLSVAPPPSGTKIRINEFLPGYLNSRGLQSPVHRTESIDYGIVLEGEITLVLDSGDVTLRAGDVVVQRGTDHAWANRTSRVCRIAFVLVDGRFEPDLLDTLPANASEHVMRHGE